MKLIWNLALGIGLACWLIFIGGSRVLKPTEALASQIQNSTSGIPSRSQATEQTFSALATKAQAEGRVRVIVGLLAAFQAEGMLSSANEVQTQRRTIAQTQNTMLNRMTAYRTASVKQFPYIPFLAMEVDAAGLQHLRSSSDVVSVQEDVALRPSLVESVPLIGVPAAWASGYTGAGQTVAILDTGVDKTHPFLAGKVVSEACYSTTDTNSVSLCPGGVAQSTAPGSGVNCVLADCDHGTHVAGIAAGKGAGFSGVAKDANVISIQVFSRFTSQSMCGNDPVPCLRAYISDQILGLQRVQALSSSFKIAAVNLSLGGDPVTVNCDATSIAMKVAIDNLRSLGIATIAASGNDGNPHGIGLPACISSTISVGSTGDGSFGSIPDGVSSFSNSASSLTLLAPGQWILSSVPGGGFANKQGTSMAAPHVAGAWAVLKSKSPTATVSEILSALTSTGVPVLDARNGLIKPRIAVDAAANALSCAFSILPNSDSFSASGGTGTVNVTAPNCCWTASSTASWITLTAGGSGCGNKTLNYSVAANPSTTARLGTMTIAGLTFTVRQAGVCVIMPISLWQTVNGTLSTSDCRSPVRGSTFYTDRYSFTATAGQQITISLSSADFDTFLNLIGPTGLVIAQDDDGGGGTNSRILPGGSFLTLPLSGTYIIEATSFHPDNTGTYTLSLTGNCGYAISPQSQTFTSSGGGGSVKVAASSGCAWSASSNANWITITSISSTEPPPICAAVIGLFCGKGQGAVNYTVAANPTSASRSGTITIAGQTFTVTQAGNVCAPTPMNIGQTKTGSLNQGDCRSPLRGSVYFADRYTFNAAAGQRVAVFLSSSGFDTYLYLIGPNGAVLNQNDNGDGGTNSRIPAGLGFFTLPASGPYTIEVTSFKANAMGNYMLSLLAPP